MKTITPRHPLNDPLRKSHFAAYGFSTELRNIFGRLRHETDATLSPFSGDTILSPTKDTGFWIIHFTRDDFPTGSGDTYTLELLDADDIEGGAVATVPNISFVFFFDQVVVTYPQGQTVDSEFAAYGTAPGSLAVTASNFTSCTGKGESVSPGPDWVLHCLVSGMSGAHCTMKVNQTGADPGAGSFVLA